ncbi:hypothetical protein GCM10009762_18150 [Dermacoccus barathri]|uniref:Uncharacterized protein n=1 Tax=Dermacoccus barathri TaxID=322601 RepID=A0ABN2BPX2_9MICO
MRAAFIVSLGTALLGATLLVIVNDRKVESIPLKSGTSDEPVGNRSRRAQIPRVTQEKCEAPTQPATRTGVLPIDGRQSG